MMRELIKAMSQLEEQLQILYDLSPNEAMALCCIAQDNPTASCISENVGLSPSNTSKVLRVLELKKLIERSMGEEDRRQMRFKLTHSGHLKLQDIKTGEIEIPIFVRPLFDKDI